ncbi:MAG: DUF2064 domain-containing protein [Paracoccaceae bacterium]
MQRTVFVMLKEPRPGRVKTRLGCELGYVPAAWWFRHQVKGLLRRLSDPRWQIVLAVSPDAEGLQSRIWPCEFPRVAQGPGHLGDRMARVLRAAPPGPACVIGGDIPGMTCDHIAAAFSRLGPSEAVFGPALDGGYWLVGLKRARAQPRDLFQNVRFSTQHALADTIATLPGYRIAKIATLHDIDTLADLVMTSAPDRDSPPA